MLNDIEKDFSVNDEDTIKYAVIALANLSSHQNFMSDTTNLKRDTAQQTKVARCKIKPLIHLLDSNTLKDT